MIPRPILALHFYSIHRVFTRIYCTDLFYIQISNAKLTIAIWQLTNVILNSTLCYLSNQRFVKHDLPSLNPDYLFDITLCSSESWFYYYVFLISNIGLLFRKLCLTSLLYCNVIVFGSCTFLGKFRKYKNNGELSCSAHIWRIKNTT